MLKNNNILRLTILFSILIFSGCSVISAEAGGKVGLKPANPDPNNPRSESIFIISAVPGQSFTQKLTLINSKQAPAKVRLYAVDSAMTNDGKFACKQYSEAKSEVGSWIKFPKEIYELPANSNLDVEFTGNVPADSEPGEQNGCIIVEDYEDRERVSGANIFTRTGVRMAITIPGDIVKKLEIEDFAHSQESEKSKLTVTLKNSGNVSLDAKINIQTKLFGIFNFSENTGEYPVLRSQSQQFEFPLPDNYLGGIFSANANVEYNNNTADSVGEGENNSELRSSIWFVVWPHWLISLFILFISLSLILVKLKSSGLWAKAGERKQKPNIKYSTRSKKQ